MTAALRILDTIQDHGMQANFVQHHAGAAVDLLEYRLGKGTKLAKIQALAPDLALAVGVESVRILAPIPGTTNIGIEVPAETRKTVAYDAGKIVGSAPHDHVLPFPVGQQVGNGVIWADLAATPHLLIAGATGSGKSVALNTILTSLIDHVDADSLRLHLVDPKRVELGQFRDAPQVENFVTDISDAVDLLDDLVDEMERRYSLFEEGRVRNITEWNQNCQDPDGMGIECIEPYHVLVVDEMADLMSQRKDDVEPLIQRLTQLARAAGIHLILATQRPSVNVITGVIKANVPSRWCFTVASGVDSKVVLDTVGAEALYGQGDSLWAPYGALKPLRVQGVWTSDAEVERAVEDAVNRVTADSDLRPTLNQRAATAGSEVTLEDMGLDMTKPIYSIDGGEWKNLGHIDEATQVAFEPTADELAIPPGEEGHVVHEEGQYVIAEPVFHPAPSPREVAEAIMADFDRHALERDANRLAWAKVATCWVAVAGIVAVLLDLIR